MYRSIFAVGSLLLTSDTLLATELLNVSAQGQVMEKTLLGLLLATILAALLALAWVFQTMMAVQRIRLLQEHGLEAVEKAGIKTSKEARWKTWYKKLTQTVPIEQEREILLDHNYDGIRELDNKLPPWWVATFYISIVFSVGYMGYQHFSDYGVSSAEEYALQMEAAEASIAAYLATQADRVDENSVVALTDLDEIALGNTLFQTNCAVCHGVLGEGGTGPNLTDEHWLNGGGVKNIFSTIKYGVPEKGMIAWKAQLSPSDMQRLSSYILSLAGTNPPNAKEPQGELWQTTETEQLSDQQQESIPENKPTK